VKLIINFLVLFVAFLRKNERYLVYFEDERRREEKMILVENGEGFFGGDVWQVFLGEWGKVYLD